MSDGRGVSRLPTAGRSFVSSPDGTDIAFDTLGTGPGLLILSGSVVPPGAYHNLAKALADSFTVHVVHRRGRGASGAQGNSYSIDRETDDIRAVLTQTGSTRLLGHSFGGLLALRTAMRPSSELPALTHVLAYEPPVSIDGSVPSDFLPAYSRALERGKSALAMTILNRGLQVGGALDRVPVLVHRLVNFVVLSTVGREIRQNLPTVSAEAAAAVDLDGPATGYRSVEAPTLLLVGERGPEYFKLAARAIAAHMPSAQVEVVAGLDHNGPMFAADTVAPIAKRFLT